VVVRGDGSKYGGILSTVVGWVDVLHLKVKEVNKKTEDDPYRQANLHVRSA
jgi:hypothetical protein